MILNHLPEDQADLATPGYREFFKNFAKLQHLPFLEIFPNQKEVDLSLFSL